MIDAEQEKSDEALDLKLLNVLMKCIEEVNEEGNLFNDDEDNDDDENRRSCSCSDDFCLSRVRSTGRYSHLSYDENHVCLCDPTDFNSGTCCCNYLGIHCNGKCRPDGYDRWLEAQRVTL